MLVGESKRNRDTQWKTNENVVSSGSHEYKTGINWLNYFSLLKIIVAYPSKVHSHFLFLIHSLPKSCNSNCVWIYFLFFRNVFFLFVSFRRRTKKNIHSRQKKESNLQHFDTQQKKKQNGYFSRTFSCQRIQSFVQNSNQFQLKFKCSETHRSEHSKTRQEARRKNCIRQ